MGDHSGGKSLERVWQRDGVWQRQHYRDTQDTFWSVLARSNGTVLVGCGEALCEIGDGQWRQLPVPRGRYASLFESRDGTLFARSAARTLRLAPGGTAFEDITGSLPREHDWRVIPLLMTAVDFHGRALVNTIDGVYRLREREWQRIAENEGLEGTVRALFTDRDGGIWMGTNNGLHRWLGDGAWTSFGTAEGLPRRGIQVVVEDKRGEVWAGSNTAGLFRGRLTDEGWRFERILKAPGIVAMVRAGDSVWLGPTDGPPLRYADGRLHVVAGLPPHVRVNEYSVDTEGRVLAATDIGLFRQHGADRLEMLWPAQSPIYTIGWAPGGDFWLGMAGGVARLAGNTVTRLRTSDRIEDRGVRAIHGDGEGRIWLGTWGHDGLAAYTVRGSDLLERIQGLSIPYQDANTFFVHADSLGQVWSGSTRGLVRFARGRWHRYDRYTGLNSDLCTSACFPQNGSAWFATPGGVAHYEPPLQSPPQEPPPVFIRKVESRAGTFSGSEIAEEQADVTVEFSVLSTALDSPPAVRYRRRPDEKWIATAARRLEFLNLPAGGYAFEVQAQGRNGQWSNSAGFSFRVLPPWWRTWWFRSALLALAAIFLAVLWRSRLNAEQNANLRRVRDMFDRYPGPAWIVTKEGRFLMVNHAMARLIGQPREKLEGQLLRACMPPSAVESFDRNFRQVREQGGQVNYVERYDNEGNCRTFDALMFAIRDGDGQLEHACMLAADITERRRLEEERELHIKDLAAANQRLSAQESQLWALAARNQRLIEEERVRLSREVHDELGQHIAAIRIGLTRLKKAKPGGTGPEAGKPDLIPELVDLTDQAALSIRHLATQLRPMGLDSLGLAAAIRWHAKECAERLGIPVECDVEEIRLPSDVETALFRIVQEGLTNILKYASASYVDIEMRRRGNEICLTIADDGVGFDVSLPRSSLGLLGMRERALAVNGQFEVVAQPGKGTRISVKVPAGSGDKAEAARQA